jgi:hypothetical protein
MQSVMRKNVTLACGVGWLLGGAIFAVSGRAAAQAAACPTGATTVYMDGSSAFKPVLQATAKALGSAVTIVYLAPGSCEGLVYLLGDSGMPPANDTTTTGSNLIYLPPTGAAGIPCTLPAGGAKVDIAISDVYPSVCAGTFDTALNVNVLGMGAKDFLGPIQAMTFAVPAMSSANNISAEAAYMVFGKAADTPADTIAPWSVPADIYVRFWDSGTLEMIGKAINLPGGKWKNATVNMPLPPQQATGSGNMISKITTAAMGGDVNGTIGILGAANIYGATGIKPLAFQAVGQSCAFYPDSSSSAADKLNVRQGRYDIWGPEHMVANVDGMGNAVGQNGNTAAVQAVISALQATQSGPTAASSDAGAGLTESQVKNVIDLIATPGANGGVVPWCAMEVSRTDEVGALSSYQSPYPCICEYETATAATVHSHMCTTCMSDTDCADAGASLTHCRYGFCEAN